MYAFSFTQKIHIYLRLNLGVGSRLYDTDGPDDEPGPLPVVQSVSLSSFSLTPLFGRPLTGVCKYYIGPSATSLCWLPPLPPRGYTVCTGSLK